MLCMKTLKRALVSAAAAGSAVAAAAQDEQAPAAPAGHEITATVTGHHEMRSLMRELSQELERMSAHVDETATVEAQQRMAGRMQELSGMLADMSGLLARPAHSAQDRALVADMRRRLQAGARPSAAVHVAEPQATSSVDARMTHLEAELDALEAQMKQIRALSDPARRNRLLGGHARTLRRLMTEVREFDRSLSPQMRDMMAGATAGASSERMMLVHDLIARRVTLMERLTEQVMGQSTGHGIEAPRTQVQASGLPTAA